MTLQLKPGTEWPTVFARAQAAVPDAFDDDGNVLNFWGGLWRNKGTCVSAVSPVDGTRIPGTRWLDAKGAAHALRASLNEHRTWSQAALDERRKRVLGAADEIAEHRELIALLLVWEVGATWSAAVDQVDTCVASVRWYAETIDQMLATRRPLSGPVSNLASWHAPIGVLMHTMLVQALAGNAAIAKVPAEGGAASLGVATALAFRHGVPITLISGGSEDTLPAMVDSDFLGCVSYLGGAGVADATLAILLEPGKRHIVEQEGLNCWGVWEYSDWPNLEEHIRRSFAHAKQHSTAYPRFVVQRCLFDDFLETYLSAMERLSFGHPLAVSEPEEPLPELDFGPLINDVRAKELHDSVEGAVSNGGVPIHRSGLGHGRFLPEQRTSAYMAPTGILNPPRSSPLHGACPFGPVDTIVPVATEQELLTAMNVGGGSLVASLASDDESTAQRFANELDAVKVGINEPYDRGIENEQAEASADSWLGAFLGGELLVHAVTVESSGEP